MTGSSPSGGVLASLLNVFCYDDVRRLAYLKLFVRRYTGGGPRVAGVVARGDGGESGERRWRTGMVREEDDDDVRGGERKH